MNRGTYGYPLPPNYATRVAPARWTNARAYTVAGTYTGFVVPANVFQIGLMVVGAGGSGAMAAVGTGHVATGGGGGGFAFGVLDVTPGQVLPTITVGAGGAALNTTASNTNGNAGGTSSFGTIVSCTGGSGGSAPGVTTNGTGGAGGTATVTGLRNSVASTGGRGGTVTSAATQYKSTGGGAAGGFFASGNGGDLIPTSGNLEYCATGGAGWGGNGSGISTSSTLNFGPFAFGGGAFNVNGASIFASSFITSGAGAGAGTAGSGYYAVSATTLSAGLGGNGIIGAPSQPLVPIATVTAFTIQPPAGSGFLSSNASNPYLMLVDLNFGGAGGNALIQASTTASNYMAGNGGNGGGGGALSNANASPNALCVAGDGGMCGGGGGLASNNTMSVGKAGNGGFFAGGGGYASVSSANVASAGDGGNGGGGGGFSANSATLRLSGAGGAGAVILFWTDGY